MFYNNLIYCEDTLGKPLDENKLKLLKDGGFESTVFFSMVYMFYEIGEKIIKSVKLEPCGLVVDLNSKVLIGSSPSNIRKRPRFSLQ